MRRKLLTIAAILTLAAVSTTILTMTVLAGSKGNPGDDDSLHPDHSSADHAANKIVHVPCATGSHHRHKGDGDNPGPNHIHHSTYYWFDSDVDDSDPPPQRVVELRCGMHHDDDKSITDWGNHGTVGWSNGKFTFEGNRTTGRGKFKGERVDYCNGLIDDGNAGAYPPFNGVRDMCRQFFIDVEQARPSSGGL